jgi:integrase
VSPRNLVRDYDKLIKQAGVRRIRIHDQRHTAITWAVEDGAPLNAVAKLAGHTQVTTTAMIYAHVTPRMERETSAKIARRLAPAEGTSGVLAP